MKGSRKSLKILIVSKNANHLHLQLNTLFKAVKTQYLHISPSEDGLHSQKLVFKVKIWRGHGPLGVWGGQTPGIGAAGRGREASLVSAVCWRTIYLLVCQ